MNGQYFLVLLVGTETAKLSLSLRPIASDSVLCHHAGLTTHSRYNHSLCLAVGSSTRPGKFDLVLCCAALLDE